MENFDPRDLGAGAVFGRAIEACIGRRSSAILRLPVQGHVPGSQTRIGSLLWGLRGVISVGRYEVPDEMDKDPTFWFWLEPVLRLLCPREAASA